MTFYLECITILKCEAESVWLSSQFIMNIHAYKEPASQFWCYPVLVHSRANSEEEVWGLQIKGITYLSCASVRKLLSFYDNVSVLTVNQTCLDSVGHSNIITEL